MERTDSKSRRAPFCWRYTQVTWRLADVGYPPVFGPNFNPEMCRFALRPVDCIEDVPTMYLLDLLDHTVPEVKDAERLHLGKNDFASWKFGPECIGP
jgi:hypothetical protein